MCLFKSISSGVTSIKIYDEKWAATRNMQMYIYISLPSVLGIIIPETGNVVREAEQGKKLFSAEHIENIFIYNLITEIH